MRLKPGHTQTERESSAGAPGGVVAGAVAVPRTEARPRRRVHTAGRPLTVLMAAEVDPVQVTRGAERVLSEHSRRLAARGHRVTVLTRRTDPTLPAQEEVGGVRILRHEVPPGSPIRFFSSVLSEGARAYRELAGEEPFDVINAHQPLAACAVMRGAGRELPPMAYTFHSSWAFEYAARGRRTGELLQAWRPPFSPIASGPRHTIHASARHHVEQYAISRSRRLLTLSRFSADLLQRVHGVLEEDVTIVPGGVDPDRFRPHANRVALRTRLKLPPEGPLLLTVRQLEPRMGLENLVEAMAAVTQAHPTACLVIGGAGPLQGALRLQAETLGLGEKIRFTGFIPEKELPAYYAAADLFVLPSRCLEGFGLITVEALACGTPVVGTPVGAIPEVLGPLDSGLLLPGAGPVEMAEWLIRQLPAVVSNEALRLRCRQYAVQHFSWDRIVDRVEALLYDAVGLTLATGHGKEGGAGDKGRAA
jgi:glycosyltransferase involved in cell wall biosynthesis